MSLHITTFVAQFPFAIRKSFGNKPNVLYVLANNSLYLHLACSGRFH